MGGKAMVGNMIRVLRARMTLLVVDESGVSPVDYSAVSDYIHRTRLSAVERVGESLVDAVHVPMRLVQVAT